MSTDYIINKPIPLNKVKKIKGIKVKKFTEDKRKYYIIFDGKNYLHYSFNDKKELVGLTRYGGNNEWNIIEKIEEHCDCAFVSEHEKMFRYIRH
jgi:hypothetical protein